MYLIDTNVISELRKRDRANVGVRAFFAESTRLKTRLYISVVTLGELRRGVEIIRHRGDNLQADKLERWLIGLRDKFQDRILDFTEESAELWGKLRVPHPEHPLDKQLAATAIIHGLTVVTRNTTDFTNTGVKVLNPFANIQIDS
jgi:predicted nucleic acid-binding protein